MTEPQQNFIVRFWYWLIASLVTFLRWLGFTIGWEHPNATRQRTEERQKEDEQLAQNIKDVLANLNRAKDAHFTETGRDFHKAVLHGNAHMTEIYINSGFPVNHQSDVSGETALHIAAEVRARNVLRSLLSTDKCDFLIRDYKGRLPSEMAFLYGRDPAVARLLRIKERKQGEENGVRVTRRF